VTLTLARAPSYRLERYRSTVLIVSHQAVMRVLWSYFIHSLTQEQCPYIDTPLHGVRPTRTRLGRGSGLTPRVLACSQVVELVPTPYDCAVRRYNIEPWTKTLLEYAKPLVDEQMRAGLTKAEATNEVLRRLDTPTVALLLKDVPVPVGVPVDTPALIERAIAKEKRERDAKAVRPVSAL
jgi:hypothetical protein